MLPSGEDKHDLKTIRSRFTRFVNILYHNDGSQSKSQLGRPRGEVGGGKSRGEPLPRDEVGCGRGHPFAKAHGRGTDSVPVGTTFRRRAYRVREAQRWPGSRWWLRCALLRRAPCPSTPFLFPRPLPRDGPPGDKLATGGTGQPRAGAGNGSSCWGGDQPCARRRYSSRHMRSTARRLARASLKSWRPMVKTPWP